MESLSDPHRRQVIERHRLCSKLTATQPVTVPYTTRRGLSAPHSAPFSQCPCELIFNYLSGLSPLGMQERECSSQLGWGQACRRTMATSEPTVLSLDWAADPQTGRSFSSKPGGSRSSLPCQHFRGCGADMLHNTNLFVNFVSRSASLNKATGPFY